MHVRIFMLGISNPFFRQMMGAFPSYKPTAIERGDFVVRQRPCMSDFQNLTVNVKKILKTEEQNFQQLLVLRASMPKS